MLALVAIVKPLPALVLALLTWRSGGSARLVAVGLLFAALGDALLLGSGDGAFLAGMLAFAAMHVCYITAFARLGRPRPAPFALAVAAYAAALIAALTILVPHAGTFAVPLVGYSLLLAGMASFAVRLGPIGALGGALFLVSDTLLAFAKFAPGVALAPPIAQTCVLAAYYAAQILIATAVLRAGATAS